MLFSEIYCAYFNAVATIIGQAIEGPIDEKKILQIVSEKAFSESMLTILPAIKNEEWLVLNRDFRTPIKSIPQMPLTTLQKRWLKALITDPRIALFGVDTTGMDDIKPLFNIDDFVFFDRYANGDPYTSEGYIANFKTIFQALKEKKRIHIEYRNRQGVLMNGEYTPYQLEYSAKDDKFRLETLGNRYATYINLARVEGCRLLESYGDNKVYPLRHKERMVTFDLQDTRSALDRLMLHFSDCRKETRRLGNDHYQVELWYHVDDETEMLIRLLSFGPVLKVTAPNKFIQLIKSRLEMQAALKKQKVADFIK